MINLRYDEFNWDAGNITKCQKHGLSLQDIESIMRSDRLTIAPDWRNSLKEERYIAIGLHNSRPVFVSFTMRKNADQILLRPISARYMHQKEAKRYAQKSTAF